LRIDRWKIRVRRAGERAPYRPTSRAHAAIHPLDLVRTTTQVPLAPSLERTWRALTVGEEVRVSVAAHVTNSIDAALACRARRSRWRRHQVVESVRAGRLRLVLTEHEPPPLPIQWVYPTSRLLSAKLRAFIDLAASRSEWRFTQFS
jgi:DNA-binding transcriptional LysR family regulator